ncbi:polysaccharide deacetylase family protein [Chengkuizengella sp. SCS-71B]|uniref:polysaccharide deacetylase family protein n=1 Tax=Chengkuizengella sp. SCS-71B TaxID=3115290 RepID=UPI0032C2304E
MNQFDIPIVMYHSINKHPQKNPLGYLSFYPEEFEAHLKMLKKLGYELINMSDLLEMEIDYNKKIAVITFDDGFVDNLLIAREIMEKYNARGTIFVNPEYAFDSKVSDVIKSKYGWGYMNFDEMREAEYSKVFDIQAHAMTHEFIFTSGKIIDIYTEDKFDKYYWLAWMLYPDTPKRWDGDAYKYAKLIPEGFPIFEYNRRLSCQKFIPNDEFIKHALDKYEKVKDKQELISILNDDEDEGKGELETHERYIEEIKVQVMDCKNVLEDELNKNIEVICFPGGGYNDLVLQITNDAGYRCYMRSSQLREDNNINHLKKMKQGKFVGLNRISFTRNYPKVYSKAASAYWVGKISMKSFQNNNVYTSVKKILRKIR